MSRVPMQAARTDPAVAALVREAQAIGLLPADALPALTEQRPWPVVLLTALGAWLSAVPLLAFVITLLGPFSEMSIGPYFVGVLMMVGSMVVLRASTLPVFVEQLSVPFLLTGAGALGFGLFRDMSLQFAAAVLCAVALGCGVVVGRTWLRVLFGAAGAALGMLALLPDSHWFESARRFELDRWYAPHAALALWLASLVCQRQLLGTRRGARIARLLEQLGTGWLLATAATLAWRSGSTFMAGGALGSGIGRELAGAVTLNHSPVTLAGGIAAAGSVLLALAGALRLWRAWPGLRQAPCAGVAMVLATLSGFLPMLGGLLLALAITASTRRWRLACVCGVAAAWIVGSFYYELAWTFTTKALVLVAGAALLGALATWERYLEAGADAQSAPMDAGTSATPLMPASRSRLAHHGAAALLVATGIAVLLVVNLGIQQKEDTITRGQPVFVPLAPVDPRSLMQGDYMRLRFALPSEIERLTDTLSQARPHIVARHDTRGVATLLHVHAPSQALAQGEFLIELTPKGGQWILVSDAWFFREGEAERFARARFGEFRVAPDGQALLVGMADADLQRIAP